MPVGDARATSTPRPLAFRDLTPGVVLGRREVDITAEMVATYNRAIGRPTDIEVPLTIWDNDGAGFIPMAVDLPEAVQSKHEYEFFAPLAIDDHLLLATTVESTHERKGKAFAVFLVSVERDGTTVALARMTMLCERVQEAGIV